MNRHDDMSEKEIREDITSLKVEFGKFEERVSGALNAVTTALQKLENSLIKQTEDHETRLRYLEHVQHVNPDNLSKTISKLWLAIGSIVVSLAGAGIGVKFLW